LFKPARENGNGTTTPDRALKTIRFIRDLRKKWFDWV
jgi:hypothetical protein